MAGCICCLTWGGKRIIQSELLFARGLWSDTFIAGGRAHGYTEGSRVLFPHTARPLSLTFRALALLKESLTNCHFRPFAALRINSARNLDTYFLFVVRVFPATHMDVGR